MQIEANQEQLDSEAPSDGLNGMFGGQLDPNAPPGKQPDPNAPPTGKLPAPAKQPTNEGA